MVDEMMLVMVMVMVKEEMKTWTEFMLKRG